MLGPLVFSHLQLGVFLCGVRVMHKETAERATDDGGHTGKKIKTYLFPHYRFFQGHHTKSREEFYKIRVLRFVHESQS